MALAFNFGGVDIAALDGIELHERRVNVYPERDLKMYKLARSDKSIITSAEFTSKRVELSGRLSGSDRYDAERKWAIVKGYLNQKEQPLIITQYGQDITYYATLSRITERFTGAYVEWTLEFTCADPVGYEAAQSTLIAATTITTATSDQSVAIQGSHYALPYFTVQLNSGTGLTSQSVTIKNAETGVGITVTRTYAAGETLEINCLERTVRIAGGDVDYSGGFPTFYPGTRTVSYIDTFTTRNISLSASYFKRYI